MLAYSSVEHMGILALGVGIGGGEPSGHVSHGQPLHHQGDAVSPGRNILNAYGTKSVDEVQGSSAGCRRPVASG